jgi:hypothetical protein
MARPRITVMASLAWRTRLSVSSVDEWTLLEGDPDTVEPRTVDAVVLAVRDGPYLLGDEIVLAEAFETPVDGRLRGSRPVAELCGRAGLALRLDEDAPCAVVGEEIPQLRGVWRVRHDGRSVDTDADNCWWGLGVVPGFSG